MTKPHFLFTEAKIGALKPSGKPAYYYDTETSGLALRVSPLGTKTFVWYRWVTDGEGSRPERRTLGRYPDLSVKQATKLAVELNLGRAQGSLPQDKRRSSGVELTLGQLFAEYLEQYAKSRCTTWRDMEKNFQRWFGDFYKRKVSSISRIEVQTHINQLGKTSGHHAANKAHDDLRAVYSWGIKKNFCACPNPAVGIDKFKVRSRERFLQPDEFARFMKAVEEEDPTMRDFFKICLFTGQRKTNVLQMRWTEINLKARTWLIPKTKNGEAFTVTLTEHALRVLKDRAKEKGSNEWVFQSNRTAKHIVEPKLAWRRILKRAKLQDLRIHDLRRTLGSYMAITNVNSPIIQKALGHKSLAAAARYQRVNSDPVRAAMNSATEAMLGYARMKSDARRRKSK